jgi:hypothetical protein
VVGAQAVKLALGLRDLALELVDQRDRCQHVRAPRIGHLEPFEQLAAALTEEVRDGAWLAEGHQRRVHSVLERDPVANQVQPPAGPLALGAHPRVRQPDRRHELAPAELGQHPGVDAVGLAGQWREALDLLGVGNLDLPAELLEAVVHEARAGHRLDRRLHATKWRQPRRQASEPVRVRGHGGLRHRRPVAVDDTDVDALATQIQSGVKHVQEGPPPVGSDSDRTSLPPRRPLFMTFAFPCEEHSRAGRQHHAIRYRCRRASA